MHWKVGRTSPHSSITHTGRSSRIRGNTDEDADISRTTNRFRTGTTYDGAGQATTDNKFRSMSFGYDANGRQVEASRTGVPDAWTVYDALGNRVATKVNDVWQYVVYDAFGKCVAEYGLSEPPALAGGQGSTSVRYIQQDWQGSVRTVTNANGFVVSRTDHQAFGGDVGYGTGQRSIDQGYNRDAAPRQGYGLTERDEASGLDHTWFRKNENSAGRWTSPDPYKGSMSLGNPQSFNRYSYVQNNPTNFVDPSGLLIAIPRYSCGFTGESHDGLIWSCQITGYWFVDDTPSGSGNGTGNSGVSGGGPRHQPDDETFNDCVTRKVKRAMRDAKAAITNVVGASVAGVGFGIVVAVLITAFIEPTQIGKAALGVGAGLVVAAIIAAIFAHKGIRDGLRSKVEETLEDCKGKPGTPANLPTADEIMRIFENGLG